jgi:hypothetical protein
VFVVRMYKRNVRCGPNAEFLNVTTVGAYSYHCVLSDQSSYRSSYSRLNVSQRMISI